MILPILKYGDRRLLQDTARVPGVTYEVSELVVNMLDTMYANGGVGLAAPQVGVGLSVFVMDVLWAATGHRAPEVFINPVIVSHGPGKVCIEEGCLSFPGVSAKIERLSSVTVAALTLQGEEVEVECTGLRALCAQHEIDHLHGRLFIHHLSRLKRGLVLKGHSV